MADVLGVFDVEADPLEMVYESLDGQDWDPDHGSLLDQALRSISWAKFDFRQGEDARVREHAFQALESAITCIKVAQARYVQDPEGS